MLFVDAVAETVSAPGTGAFTLGGAITGCTTFAANRSVGDRVRYVARAVDANGNATGGWEEGYGILTGSTTLTRDTILGSSNAGAAVNFTGTTYVSDTILGRDVIPRGRIAAISRGDVIL